MRRTESCHRRRVFDHYKAWINLARCHGSDSYVILPGRDYADSSYYRDNIRNHTTAAVAFLYSYSTPKLRIQGIDGQTTAATASNSNLPEPPAGELHTFRSADGTKSIEARLVAFDPKSGQLRVILKNGRTMDLQFPTLSKEDQDYVIKESAKEE